MTVTGIRKLLKIGDYLIVVLLLVLAVISGWTRFNHKTGTQAVVYSDGIKQAVLPLHLDRRIHVQGPLGLSVIEVSEGAVHMVSSPCPHQICVKMGRIMKSESIIVCVPNRIFIRIEGNDHNQLDAITQ